MDLPLIAAGGIGSGAATAAAFALGAEGVQDGGSYRGRTEHRPLQRLDYKGPGRAHRQRPSLIIASTGELGQPMEMFCHGYPPFGTKHRKEPQEPVLVANLAEHP